MKLRNYEDFLAFAEKAAAGDDGFGEERERVNGLVNEYRDGRNAERLLKMLGLSRERTDEDA